MNESWFSRGGEGEAVLMIVICNLALATSDALIKLSVEQIGVWQLYVMRAAFALPLLAFLMARWRCSARPQRRRWVALRSVLMALMWLLVYTALPLLPLSLVAAGLYTAPLMVAVLDRREALDRGTLIALIVGFGGVLAVLQPGTEHFSMAMLLPLGGAVCYALAALITRYRCQYESALMLSLGLNLSFPLLALPMLALLAVVDLPADRVAHHAFVLSGWQEATSSLWGVSAVLAFLIVTASVTMARAYQLGSAVRIATCDYSYLIFATLWGLVLFAEWPGVLSLVGMVMIAVAGSATFRAGRRRC
ncbi:DMT family transporter [Kushneria aurantia]|uniref:DMT family transporter n=1 Tax=Kushneria aurantia TaxID=504092 RepID=A0ABV6G1Y9_9GAMM|nr:DMT family transporter [Kushneria aurantia]